MREDDLITYEQSRKNGLKDYDDFYQWSRTHTDWASPASDISLKLLFLNQFGCRVQNRTELRLREVLKDISPLFDQLRGIELQDLSENKKSHAAIEGIFDRLNGCAPTFAIVATSKFIHVTCPRLLTMIDGDILGYLTVRGAIEHLWNGDHYITLLEYYCQEANELIVDIMQKYGVERSEAIAIIREKDASALGSIPRIIDKHFFWLAHGLGRERCKRI